MQLIFIFCFSLLRLLQCNDSYSKGNVDDIRIWLQQTYPHDETYSDCVNDVNKQLIDTRTWTRPKKRFSRLSFESIKEVTSPPTLQSMKNDVWQLSNDELLNDHSDKQQLELDSNKNSDEMIPAILRLSMAGSSNFGHLTTGQESLEAFLNMSQSNGIDSFINMEAPEFNETFVNTTRPSIMSASSSSIYTRDDNNCSMNQSIGMADSQILTDSMMHTSIFNDMSEMNFNDAFANDNANVSVIENPNYSANKFDQTIISGEDTFVYSTLKSNEKKMNATFTPRKMSDSLNTQSFIINQTFDADSCETNHLSYIVIKETESTDDKYLDCLDTVNEENVKVELNTTFDAGSSSSHDSINSTLTLSPRRSENSSKTSNDNIEPLESLNMTYSENENESPEDSAYKINKTYQTSPNSLKTIKSTVKKPLSTNNQQLNYINSTFVTETRMNDETFDENVPSMPPPTNRYQTYRRNPMETKKKNLPQLDTTYDQNFVPPNPPPPVNRYQTYRKNSAPISQTKNTHVISSDNRPEVVGNQAKSLENLVGIKSNIQIPRKLHVPKNFSRLPQSLQKSNPNLPSTNGLKMAAIPTRISNFGFNRQRQIKSGDPSLTSKLYSIAKLSKCGSEQILVSSTNNSEYLENRGSTESIESTQSAHSAPDLDDRLSTCSDSSHNSYCRRTMNVDELKKIVQRQEESLEHECMAERKILENTWIADESNLPSPILKDCGMMNSHGSSPNSADSTLKTSSPLLSPTESIKLLNANTQDELSDDKTTCNSAESEQTKKLMVIQ